jgi:hypothetical protein
MEQEVWKPVHGFESYYEISTLGRVRSLIFRQNSRWSKVVNLIPRIKIMKLTTNKVSGYIYISLRKNKKVFTFSLHRLLALHFIDNPFDKKEVNHINGLKTDNRLQNLEWVTAKENTTHYIENNLKPSLVEGKEKAEEVRKLHKLGMRPIEIMKQLSVSKSSYYRIILNKSYGKSSK